MQIFEFVADLFLVLGESCHAHEAADLNVVEGFEIGGV